MLDNSRKVDILQFLWENQLKEFTDQIWEIKPRTQGRK